MDVAALPAPSAIICRHNNFDWEQVAVTRITHTQWQDDGHRNGHHPPPPRWSSKTPEKEEAPAWGETGALRTEGGD